MPLLVHAARVRSWASLSMHQGNSDLCLYLHVVLSILNVSVCLFSSYKDIHHIGLGPTLVRYDLIFT